MKSTNNLPSFFAQLTAISAIVLLAACGGGGDDGAPVEPEPNSGGNNGGGNNGGGNNGSGAGSGGGGGGNGNAQGPRTFGEPNNDQIRPGVRISSANGSCTSNFLYFTDVNNYYIGAAAHCFSPDTNNGIDACETQNAAYGSLITIENAEFPGTLEYSSWVAMQANGETPGSDACVFNDFALVRIDDRDLDNIHPAALVFGGPIDLQRGLAAVGDEVVSYGQSSFHFGAEDLEAKEGVIRQIQGDGINYRIETDNPGLSGDSGSGVLHESGRALGVLATVGVSFGLGGTVSNGVVNLERALNYAQPFVPGNLQLETWSEFSR